jgi:hypothetical protein
MLRTDTGALVLNPDDQLYQRSTVEPDTLYKLEFHQRADAQALPAKVHLAWRGSKDQLLFFRTIQLDPAASTLSHYQSSPPGSSYVDVTIQGPDQLLRVSISPRSLTGIVDSSSR